MEPAISKAERLNNFIKDRLLNLSTILTARRNNYDPPPVNFQRIADYWTIDLSNKLKDGERISMTDVAQCMVSVKKARILAGYTTDSALDGMGYFMCMMICEDDKGGADKRLT